MAPQRTPRRLASVHHHFSETPNVSPRRHPMLLRSMATPDAPTADTSHSIQETSDSLLGLNSSTTNPSDLSAYPPSHSLLGASGSLIIPNSASSDAPLHSSDLSAYPPSHSLLGASGSLIIPNSASSDAPLHSSGELPSKPVVPVELMTTTDGNSIRNLEMFCTHSQRLYNEQKNSLEFTKQCIDLVEQQCTDLTKIKHMRSVVQKFNYSCPFCKDLAWNAHVYAPSQFTLWTHWLFEVYQQQATTIHHVRQGHLLSIERIGKEAGITAPPQHYLTWPERQ
ncbi:hypothetical protein F5051DRAFT_445013 [Lentinula edodes]|nr:hypothetical protein F5051DRAFT_445013 [Lentinula edodes]